MLKGRKKKSRKEWAALVDASDSSKLPVREFCAKHNISSAGLYKWRSRLKNKSVFVPVKVISQEVNITSSTSQPSLQSTASAISQPTASQLIPLLSDLESTAASNPDRASLSSEDSVPEAPSQISSRFVLHSGSIKLEFPSGCTSTELQLVAGALSC